MLQTDRRTNVLTCDSIFLLKEMHVILMNLRRINGYMAVLTKLSSEPSLHAYEISTLVMRIACFSPLINLKCIKCGHLLSIIFLSFGQCIYKLAQNCIDKL